MKKIVLVEDTVTLANEIADILRMEGYQVNIMRNGQEAIDFLHNEKSDLIVTDLLMPVKDGWQLLVELKGDARLKNIPVIVLTAKVGAEVEARARQLGAAEVITKPCKAKFLIESIGKIVSLRG